MLVQRCPMLKALRDIATACAFALIGAVTAAPSSAASLSPEDIWQRTVAGYAALHSYSDTGTVLVEGPGISDKHSFKTRYQAPRSFYFDFVKSEDVDRYVIWSDAEAFHTWWKTTGVEDEYTRGSGTAAFGQADYLTAGSALKLPPLIFSQSGLQGPLTNFKDPVLDGSETIGGHDCHRLVGMTRDVYTATGREVNIRKLTVWIESDNFLILKVVEGSPKGMPPMQAMQTTTTFEPVANPKLDEASFKFDVPTAN